MNNINLDYYMFYQNTMKTHDDDMHITYFRNLNIYKLGYRTSILEVVPEELIAEEYGRFIFKYE